MTSRHIATPKQRLLYCRNQKLFSTLLPQGYEVRREVVSTGLCLSTGRGGRGKGWEAEE